MSDLQNTREYRGLKRSFENDPAFEMYFKACIEDTEETFHSRDEPPMDIDVLYRILVSALDTNVSSS